MKRDVNLMDLEKTAKLMTSSDYKERFQAEYYQLAIRLAKLQAMLDKWDKGQLTFKPTCPEGDLQRPGGSNGGVQGNSGDQGSHGAGASEGVYILITRTLSLFYGELNSGSFHFRK